VHAPDKARTTQNIVRNIVGIKSLHISRRSALPKQRSELLINNRKKTHSEGPLELDVINGDDRHDVYHCVAPNNVIDLL
jgi:hypothetical protein